MDSDLVAALLWTAFWAALVGAVGGVVYVVPSHRLAGLTVLLVSTVVLLGFSLAAGFSVGRFTAAIPVLLTGVMLGFGRGRLALLLAVATAAVVYYAGSWLLTPLAFQGGVLAWVFGAWAIPSYVLLAAAAYVVAVTRPTGSASRDSP